MSIDFCIKVFIGAPIEEVTIKTTKTKYNEDTGQPYKIEDYHDEYKLGNMSFIGLDEMESWCQDRELDIVEMGDECFVGMVIGDGDVKAGGGLLEFDLETINGYADTVFDTLRQVITDLEPEDVAVYFSGRIF